MNKKIKINSIIYIAHSENVCKKIRNYGLYFLIISVILQMLIDSSSDNIISSISILIFTYILLKTTVNSRNITIYPLQSFFIISFNISTLSGALIIQSLNVTPVIYSLKEPIITFIECGLFQIILNIILLY